MTTVTIGGLPGTGTSTLCRILEQELEIPYVYAGQLFRQEAAERGMSLAEFGELCQEDPSVDQQLDDHQVELLRRGDILLEGRLAGWLAHRNDVAALKVWVVCEDVERFRRIAERDGGDASAQRDATLEREASEADRYERYYGVDLSELHYYDLILDSTSTPPAELAAEVLAALRTV